jgi:hypothetical protein
MRQLSFHVPYAHVTIPIICDSVFFLASIKKNSAPWTISTTFDTRLRTFRFKTKDVPDHLEITHNMFFSVNRFGPIAFVPKASLASAQNPGIRVLLRWPRLQLFAFALFFTPITLTIVTSVLHNLDKPAVLISSLLGTLIFASIVYGIPMFYFNRRANEMIQFLASLANKETRATAHNFV